MAEFPQHRHVKNETEVIIAGNEPHGNAAGDEVAELIMVGNPGKITAGCPRIFVVFIIKPIRPAEIVNILNIPHNVIGA